MPGIPTLIKGYVRNASGGGVEGVNVAGALGSGSFATVTAADGGYFASWVGSGVLTVTATKPGFAAGSVKVTLKSTGGVIAASDIKLAALT
jgi:hypothetical protein